MATDNVTKEREEQLKQDNPDRVVDGVYYEDDEELETAKKAYEERLKKAQDEATAKATAKAQADAQALKTINELLYGENSQLTQEQLEATVGGIELNAVLGNSLEIARRQRLLDPTKYMTEFKSPNPGKFMPSISEVTEVSR